MSAPEVSHGRGGAGNINPDDTQYVDGEIVRQGDVGTHGDGAYSTGRGGTSSIPLAINLPSSLCHYTTAAMPSPNPHSISIRSTPHNPSRLTG